jgi:alkylation response protein AidB-like acyl-CoA dehydrogenase
VFDAVLGDEFEQLVAFGAVAADPAFRPVRRADPADLVDRRRHRDEFPHEVLPLRLGQHALEPGKLRLTEHRARRHDRMLEIFAEMMRLARAGKEIPLAQRARYRWDGGQAIEWSVRAVDRLFEASGGRALFLANPIQRAWRDVHAMRAHAGNNPDRSALVFARSELGLPPDDIRF